MDAKNRHCHIAKIVVALNSRCTGGASATIESMQLAAAGIMDNHERIAAQPADEGIDDLQHRAGRDSRINRIAARLQEIQTGFRSQVMGCSDDTATSQR